MDSSPPHPITNDPRNLSGSLGGHAWRDVGLVSVSTPRNHFPPGFYGDVVITKQSNVGDCVFPEMERGESDEHDMRVCMCDAARFCSIYK